DPKQTSFKTGALTEGQATNTEERRAMMRNHCRMILTIDGGEGSRALAAFAVRRERRRIPVLPVVATPGTSAARGYWELHGSLIRQDFDLTDEEARALSVVNNRRDDRGLAALIVGVLERKAGKT